MLFEKEPTAPFAEANICNPHVQLPNVEFLNAYVQTLAVLAKHIQYV